MNEVQTDFLALAAYMLSTGQCELVGVDGDTFTLNAPGKLAEWRRAYALSAEAKFNRQLMKLQGLRRDAN